MKTNHKHKPALAITALILAILACNLPAQGSGTEATPTNTAQAVQTFTAIPSQTSTAAPPPTPSTPTVSVNTATNCRTGPGPNYDLVLVFQPGASAPVIAKYSAANYWIITTPTGGTCWLWGAYATVQGNTSTLAEMAPPAAPPVAAVPPTAKPEQPQPEATATEKSIGPIIVLPPVIKLLPPPAPSSLNVNTNCQFITFPTKVLIGRTDTLTWTSVNNAGGYYIYINGAKFGSSAVTVFVITTNITENPTQFGVAAYNGFGTSAITNATGQC